MSEIVLRYLTYQMPKIGFLIRSHPSAQKQRIELPLATDHSIRIRTYLLAESSATGTIQEPRQWLSGYASLDVSNFPLDLRKPTSESLELQARIKSKQGLALARAEALEHELGIEDPVDALIQFFSRLPGEELGTQVEPDDLFGL